jgi:hypothetical protein
MRVVIKGDLPSSKIQRIKHSSNGRKRRKPLSSVKIAYTRFTKLVRVFDLDEVK